MADAGEEPKETEASDMDKPNEAESANTTSPPEAEAETADDVRPPEGKDIPPETEETAEKKDDSGENSGEQASNDTEKEGTADDGKETEAPTAETKEDNANTDQAEETIKEETKDDGASVEGKEGEVTAEESKDSGASAAEVNEGDGSAAEPKESETASHVNADEAAAEVNGGQEEEGKKEATTEETEETQEVDGEVTAGKLKEEEEEESSKEKTEADAVTKEAGSSESKEDQDGEDRPKEAEVVEDAPKENESAESKESKEGEVTDEQPKEGETGAAEVKEGDENSEKEKKEEDKSKKSKDTEDAANVEENEENAINEQEEKRRKKKEKPQLPPDFFYKVDEWVSRPKITEDSGLPMDILKLYHSFGYDCLKRDNISLLDDEHICYIAGNLLQIYGLKTKEQIYLRSSSGGGIGAVTVHKSHRYFAVAEKGEAPNVLIYSYPELQLYRILRGGTQTAYANLRFSPDGELLATVGSDPDFMLTVWDWKNEQTVLRCKAFSQDIFRVSWSAELEGILTTAGTGHIRFWKMADTFTGLKLQGHIGKFGKTEISDIEGYVELPDGKVLSGCEWGNMLLWDGGLIKVEVTRKQKKPCHNGPIQQIVMDEGELMTVGIDGYIRTWDFEAIDTAEASDESAYFELEPMNEMRVDNDVRLKHIVKSLEEDSTIWYAQDASGAIWKLDLSFSHTSSAPEKVSSFHAGPIAGCATSPVSYLAATVGIDSSVKIYDFAAKKIMAENYYIGNGSSIIWAPECVDPKGKTVIAGFSDGVVRVLNFGENPELDPTRKARQVAQLSLVAALKPHSSAVRSLAIDEEGDFLVTGSDDSTIFFFTIAGTSYDPIGFTSVPGPVKQLEWVKGGEDKPLSVLVFLVNGGVCEVVAPDPASVDHSKTFEIIGLKPHREYMFRSIKSRLRHEEELERIRKEDEERKKKEEEERRIRRERGLETEEDQQQREEEEKERERKRKEEEEAWEPFIPEEPSPILKAVVCKSEERSGFWLSMGQFDAGYLYSCDFADLIAKETKTPEEYDEPKLAVPVTESFDIPVSDIHFSLSGKRAIFGMEDGSIRVCQLETPFDLSTMGPFWTLSMHDNQYGVISQLTTSYDDHFLLTVGDDGNFFVIEMMDEDLQEKLVKEYKAKIPSARKIEGALPDDIDDPNAYSIEEHKQKSEHDRMVKLAEEKKVATRRRIQELRKEFKKLKDQNESLPERSRIVKKEMDLVPDLREDLIDSRNEKIDMVHKEMAWESEKHQIALNKLTKRYREYMECGLIVVRAFLTSHEVRTNRAAVLSDDFYNMKQEMERRTTYFSTKDATRDPTMMTQGETTGIGDGLDGGGTDVDALVAKSTVQGARGERIARQLKKLEEKKKRRAQRKNQWQTLYNNKPDENYEDPNDVAAIKEAKENMGDFKLKTASDYVVPDHLRMNTDKARNRLVEVEEKIHDLKFSMNERILQLRDRKVDIIDVIKTMRTRLEEIQKKLPVEHHKPIPPVPVMADDEMPEKKYEYTRESLLEFKKVMEEKRLAELRGEEPTSFGSFTKPAAGVGGMSGPAPRRPQRGEKDAPISELSESVSEAPAVKMSRKQQARAQIEKIRLISEQDRLLKEIDDMLRNFDAELRLVRHDKMNIDTRLKKGELRQLTLYEEFLLLREFEKSEKGLADRVEQKQAEKIEMQGKVIEVQGKLELKKKDIEKLQEKEKALHETFKQSLGENNKFADYLTKVFKKKIKRKKKETEGGEEENEESTSDVTTDSDEEDESSDDDDSEWDESEEESDEEGMTFDLDMCPPGCDQTLYDNTCQLREKRLDIEEELTEEKKILDSLKKESESLQKKSKIIDSSLKQAENDLEEFQLKKQKKLNELDVIVILKLHQLLYHETGVLPADLSQTLVFERSNLLQLRRRIKELEEEKQQQKRQQKEARRRHIQLMKDRKVYQAHINEMQEQCDAEMVNKFGKIEDMERLEQVIVNPKIEELTVKMLMLQEEQLQELMEIDDKIRGAKEHVIEQTRENTKHLTQMLMLYNEQLAVESKLNSRQKNLGSEYRGARPSEVEEMARLVQLVQIQAQELNALKEEIGMLSRKGGHILPPVQPPMPVEKGPSIL